MIRMTSIIYGLKLPLLEFEVNILFDQGIDFTFWLWYNIVRSEYWATLFVSHMLDPSSKNILSIFIGFFKILIDKVFICLSP